MLLGCVTNQPALSWREKHFIEDKRSGAAQVHWGPEQTGILINPMDIKQ